MPVVSLNALVLFVTRLGSSIIMLIMAIVIIVVIIMKIGEFAQFLNGSVFGISANLFI